MPRCVSCLLSHLWRVADLISQLTVGDRTRAHTLRRPECVCWSVCVSVSVCVCCHVSCSQVAGFLHLKLSAGRSNRSEIRSPWAGSWADNAPPSDWSPADKNSCEAVWPFVTLFSSETTFRDLLSHRFPAQTWTHLMFTVRIQTHGSNKWWLENLINT